jgi:branched-chain amino acid aminotransferase
MYKFLPIAYFENQFIPFEDAKLSIATHALHYGTGAFGGLRGIPDPNNPQQILLFRLDRHCQRLGQSAKLLHFDELTADFIQNYRICRKKSAAVIVLYSSIYLHL